MNVKRRPRARLDALLTGLEDEVLRLEDRIALWPDEDGVTTDVDAARSSIESLVKAHVEVVEQGGSSLSGHTGKYKTKVARMLTLLSQRGGVKWTRGGLRSGPEVRLAFSGDEEPSGEDDSRAVGMSERRGTGKTGGNET